MSVKDRFLKYVSYDTQSDPHSACRPSTAKQMELARELKKELEELGLEEIRLGVDGIVYGALPANCDEDFPVIGLIAHMDTAQEMPGKDVKARVIENWDGSVIELNDEYSMSAQDFPALKNVIGDSIVVTDGTTLLGADDKAGIAIIMQTLEEMAAGKEPHGKILVAFTPDEEIGHGTDNFDLEGFKADFAYTLDGGEVEDVDFETFNAASATVTIHGKAIHPGAAKNKMINAALIACQYAMLMPMAQTPANTSGSEGFIHLLDLEGACEKAVLEYIIRDHDKEKLEEKKRLMMKAVDLINAQYGPVCEISIEHQYDNMKEYMKGDFTAVNRAFKALESMGIAPESNPVRGGTDGAMLTVRGLITPNLGTGSGNCHGRYEFASIDKMETMVKVLHHILEDQ